MNQALKTFTVFCRDRSNVGTTWIDRVDAADADQAAGIGREQCAESWGCCVGQVVAIGVAEGDVKIVHWEDLDE